MFILFLKIRVRDPLDIFALNAMHSIEFRCYGSLLFHRQVVDWFEAARQPCPSSANFFTPTYFFSLIKGGNLRSLMQWFLVAFCILCRLPASGSSSFRDSFPSPGRHLVEGGYRSHSLVCENTLLEFKRTEGGVET